MFPSIDGNVHRERAFEVGLIYLFVLGPVTSIHPFCLSPAICPVIRLPVTPNLDANAALLISQGLSFDREMIRQSSTFSIIGNSVAGILLIESGISV